ncbi:GLPGLI family protein [Lacibacter luteus]|uniref:GLPGLI family protein n=1 Tax=Lacibacter luteus TaxID=2508719 RepID=A0A4V1M7D2_9BACT|nr:GLPGLI family protein [Lacibacter luteus]RXK59334.1 GLPGLI family protein [Lacibacter luteus]
MKHFSSLLVTIISIQILYSQSLNTLKLKYTVTQKKFNINEEGQSRLIAKQERLGFYFKVGSQYFFYSTPFDTTSIVNQEVVGNNRASVSFLKDSLQQVQYRNTDSMFNLVMIQRSGQQRVNRFDLVKGEQKWEIKPETKKVGTFQCQKAVWIDDGFLVAEIWFAPDVPVYFGLQNYNEVPGMIVEATQFYPHIEYKLIEYVADAEVKDDEIFPAYLRVSPNYMSRENYEQNLKRLRTLRKTQGRIN